MKHFKYCLLLLVAVAAVAASRAENWAQWRGPLFNGSTTETGLPTSWSTNDNVAWSTPLPGVSGATPAIWGDTIFVSSPDAEHNLNLLCLDRLTGQIRWQKQLGTGDFVKGNNNLASPSPVTDGQAVYALFGTGDLAALDFAGNVLWARNLGKEYGKFAIMWLYGSSPLLFNGRLYVQVLQTSPVSYKHATDDKPERESYLLCLDPQTGKNIWKHTRTTDAQQESMESYATPVPFRGAHGVELLLVGGNCVTAHNPDTGAELWRCYGLNPKKSGFMRVVPSAVGCGDLIYACGPKKEAMLAIRDGGTGDVSENNIAWKFSECTPDVCTPLIYQNKLFVEDGDRKTIACLDPKTGAKKWSGNLGFKEIFRASPTGAAGKIYCISEPGHVVILDAGDEFKILNTIAMGEGPCRSSIAVSQGQLFIRTARHLYCIGKK